MISDSHSVHTVPGPAARPKSHNSGIRPTFSSQGAPSHLNTPRLLGEVINLRYGKVQYLSQEKLGKNITYL